MNIPNSQNYWTYLRKELLSWFDKNNPTLGALYKGAVQILYDYIPGYVHFVSHAVREIRNRLPDVIAGGVVHVRLDYKNRLDIISKRWQKDSLPMDGSLPTNVIDADSMLTADKVPIPRNIYSEFSKLIGDHTKAREKPYEMAKRLFKAIDPKNEQVEEILRPRINMWIENTDWFVKRVHVCGSKDDEADYEEFVSQFENFEYGLFGIIGEFFKTVEELDEILEESNS
jgi:hypothetical protein